ncbi:MAG: tRNA uridine-5-carboxymethylaminomethyl(34) synthesis enzyme MnmG [Phycisphaerae bacterium]|nr:tRNA uridine-5-carboxymethylaminomethyl(34) synthesis enzyme MnmG [Phycisphaerae bacterium]NUQ47669.1 tRNA uridine-5-carboxymethylaminomethyl(34) synthesis enzyme MnmG [Phycisphaerae bacterium]
MSDVRYEVLIVGGGHAGAEAAWAAARLGVPTAMITFDRSAIGRMSCNPAIGGIGKGQMVREIDALGGLMGLAADAAGIQFRILNRSKGPAVQAPRAQCDRRLYEAFVQRLLGETPGLTILDGSVDEILTDDRAPPRVCGVRLADGRTIRAAAVVLTTGTFLRALMHCGERQSTGGRIGEASAERLSVELRRLGLELGRLKTGTPPRVARDSVNDAALVEQPGDEPPRPFSFLNDTIANRQVCCWITHTNETVHELIRANLHRAPMYSGQIASRGPRYCPSIEDKVVRFADKPRHQVFLEPEGYDSDRIYCNGISTSLPPDVQAALVRSIVGLENARVVQWGYAVEYDFVPPHQTRATLESKVVGGLYLAGQINGTSGYEEAAGQGLVAGANAALAVMGREPLILSRDASYIGVMADDLVTRGVTEPYRMFTSRAEHRLSLRSDNADVRLTPIGRRIGLVDDVRWAGFEERRRTAAAFEAWLSARRRDGRPLRDWLVRPDVDWREAVRHCGWSVFDSAVEAFVTDLRYAGYLERQAAEIQRMAAMDARAIPAGFDFLGVPGLRAEACERFAGVGPSSLGQARRISGITPADVALLALHLTSRRSA